MTVTRDQRVQHIYRFYAHPAMDMHPEDELITLCWSCGDGYEHAETPDQTEELECENCGAINEQAAIHNREMTEHLADDPDDLLRHILLGKRSSGFYK